jgi:hypothetical protein
MYWDLFGFTGPCSHVCVLIKLFLQKNVIASKITRFNFLKKIKEKRYDINNIKKRGRFIMF